MNYIRPALLITLLALPMMAACSHPDFDSPDESAAETDVPATRIPPPTPSSALDEPLRRFKGIYGALPGVEGTGIGMTRDGREAISVWVSDARVGEKIPEEFEGYPVIVREVPGGFHATPVP